MIIAAILLPVVLALFSRRMVVLVSCISGAVIVFLHIYGSILRRCDFSGCSLSGSVIIALTGIVSRRKAPYFTLISPDCDGTWTICWLPRIDVF